MNHRLRCLIPTRRPFGRHVGSAAVPGGEGSVAARLEGHREGETDPVLEKALKAVIDQTYARFIFRPATSEEVARHLGSFYCKLPTSIDQRRAVREGKALQCLNIRPLYLETDFTTQCNLRCIFCHFSTEDWSKQKRDDISLEEFARIAARAFPLCEKIHFGFMTEPLLHRQLGHLLAITSRYDVPWVSIVTNGMLLREPIIERMIETGVKNIDLSIDAATKPTYERIRRKGNFDKLIANIKLLNTVKRRRQSQAPRTRFNFILMRSNAEELPAVIRLAHELEVSAVQVVHLIRIQGLTEGEGMNREPILCNRILDETRCLGDRHGIEVKLPANFEPSRTAEPLLQLGLNLAEPSRRREKAFFELPVYGDELYKDHCLWPWHYVIVDRYGWVYPCGSWQEERMGNLLHEPLEHIWNNARYRALRISQETKALGHSCRNCYAFLMGNVNRDEAFSVVPNGGGMFGMGMSRLDVLLELVRRDHPHLQWRINQVEIFKRRHPRMWNWLTRLLPDDYPRLNRWIKTVETFKRRHPREWRWLTRWPL